MEPTSEQELKQLLDEGRITEEEYKELKWAMAEREKEQFAKQNETENMSKSAHKLGKVALVLTLCGVVLPALGYLVVDLLAGPNASPQLAMAVFPFLGMELAGFVMGIISWKSGLGKAAAITAGIVMVMSAISIA